MAKFSPDGNNHKSILQAAHEANIAPIKYYKKTSKITKIVSRVKLKNVDIQEKYSVLFLLTKAK